jgi:hypothetical protein
MRIRYDAETDAWGELETVLAAAETGLSITEPKVSPDGRFLLFCMSDCGNFPVYHNSSDLYLMDINTRQYRRLDINSDRTDSWHSWSSNSHWIVFSSKRLDGLLSRPFFSYVDKSGTFHKPFLLPQKNPTFYKSLLRTYNVPELVTGPVEAGQRDLAEAIINPHTLLTPTIRTPAGRQTIEDAHPGETTEYAQPASGR